MKHLIRGDDVLSKHENFKLVGRAEELKRLSAILMRNRANSVILVGPGGVGCTALCLGLQASKEDPTAPFDIVSKRFYWLESDSLFASGNSEMINSSFQKMMDILYRTPDSVLIIEDTRDFIEAARNNGSIHFINAITAAVKEGKTQVIFETRDDDLDVVLKCHSDMRECFTLMDLGEPAQEALELIIDNNSKSLEEYHGIKIADEAKHVAIELTNKYRTRDMGLSRAQPERTMTLLDRSLASYRLIAHEHPPRLKELERQLLSVKDNPAKVKDLEKQILEFKDGWTIKQASLREYYSKLRNAEIAIIEQEDSLRAQLEEEANREKEGVENEGKKAITDFKKLSNRAGFESQEVREIRNRIKEYESILKENREKYETLTKIIDDDLLLTRDFVLREFSSISGISANKLNEDEREKLVKLKEDLQKRIFGQDHVLDLVSNGVKVARLGKRDKNRPLPFLFLGPSGVGKTELAKALASSLLDDENALTRFDMSEYMEKHAVAKLIGAPPGYEGFEVGGILTNAMRRNPNRVLLFDEIEKAHPDVFNIFLQILSDGRLTDNVGRTVSFAHSILMMTTNIGQVHFLNPDFEFSEARDAAFEELGKHYRSEFLNRFNGRQNIMCFNALDLDSIKKIVKREIVNINSSYKEQGIIIDVDDKSIGFFCEDHYDPKVGARGLPGYIQVNLEPFIVNTLLENPETKMNIKIEYNRDTKKFEFYMTENTNEPATADQAA